MYTTIEAKIDHGNIIPLEPGKLPKYGKVLLTIIPTKRKKPNWTKIKECIGSFGDDVDPAKWQKKIRDEWNSRI